MADVVNRTTKQHLKSRHTPDYPTASWIHNPDLSALSGVPTKYWNIVGDVVSEMSAAEKQAVDDAVLRTWRLHCDTEGIHYAKKYDATAPTQCPINAVHTISQVVQQAPLGESLDEVGDTQCTFVTNAQSIIIAKVV